LSCLRPFDQLGLLVPWLLVPWLLGLLVLWLLVPWLLVLLQVQMALPVPLGLPVQSRCTQLQLSRARPC
jgi:hypothetical protein